ncbi:lycopene cyclase domain-containing protein [Salibacter halophilus]|uniref:Lycopene cyclase domain-containing protein n=1 Tax=Salibacter halophilus TaxID=1803916 RepID=A0A6N6M939_9FLAO|nr:lycopene cyclase domain-containing protein [Salibacter halophilus]KAB1063646.1 lycopene cyclase domain-containing protein [Salibacter halophilus]
MLDTPYLYLLLNLATISIPLIRSFEPRIDFAGKWKALFPAILAVGVFFITWDSIFTQKGVWGFNDRYLTGIELMHLPLGEWLFFITIPYACVFIYEVLNYFWPKNSWFNDKSENISLILISVSIVVGIYYHDLNYTFWTFIFLAAFIAYMHYFAKVEWLGNFYRAYLVALIGFFAINGVLTGTGIEEEVVWYNAREFIGLRMGTIPFEDLFYGMLLIMMNVWLFEAFKEKWYVPKNK